MQVFFPVFHRKKPPFFEKKPPFHTKTFVSFLFRLQIRCVPTTYSVSAQNPSIFCASTRILPFVTLCAVCHAADNAVVNAVRHGLALCLPCNEEHLFVFNIKQLFFHSFIFHEASGAPFFAAGASPRPTVYFLITPALPSA